MYVLGINHYDFIKIVQIDNLYDWNEGKLSYEIKRISYDTPLKESTIFHDYKKAKALLQEIQTNFKQIKFNNNNFVADVLDKDNSFDIEDYVSKLKVYELVPQEIKEGDI